MPLYRGAILCYGYANVSGHPSFPLLTILGGKNLTETGFCFNGVSCSEAETERRQNAILSEFIHYLRVSRQISIFDCAAVLGIDYQILDDIECGKAQNIHTAFLLNFIKFIHSSPSKSIPVSDNEELWSEMGKLSFNLRKKLGYSLDDLADFTNLKVPDIDDIECCHRKNNTANILKLIEFYVHLFGKT